MNFAFPAVVIAVLLLPGAIFRYSYARGSWSWNSPTSVRPITDELAYGAIIASLLHVVWLKFASAVGYRADFESLVALLLGNFGPNAVRYEAAIQSLSAHPGAIAVYQGTLLVSAALLGHFGHVVVRHFKLDLKTSVLRFKNEWHYLLTGEATQFHESIVPDAQDFDGVFLSAVVDHGKESYLYRGIVEGWSFDGSGQLDTIRLTLAHRRLLSSDRAMSEGGPDENGKPAVEKKVPSRTPVLPDDRYYDIRGDIFVLRYSQVRTLNLDYFCLEEMEDVGTSGGVPES